MPLPPLRGKGLQVDADIAHQITTSNEDRTIVQVAKVVSEVGCKNFLALLLVKKVKPSIMRRHTEC